MEKKVNYQEVPGLSRTLWKGTGFFQAEGLDVGGTQRTKGTLTLFFSVSCCSKSCFSFCSCPRSMAPTSPFGVSSVAGSCMFFEVTYKWWQQVES